MFLNIDWKSRFKNPIFYVNIALAVFTPILAYFGLKWEDMTTWGAIADITLQAVKNPVVVSSMIVAVYNAIVDTKTKGISDN